MCQGRLQPGADRNIRGIHVDGGVSIYNSHKLLLDGECNEAGANGKEAVGAGQRGMFCCGGPVLMAVMIEWFHMNM